MNPEISEAANRILTALLNGGYQGLALTIVVWLGLKLVPRSNAATRYAVWLGTLLVVLALPILHFARGSGALDRAPRQPDNRGPGQALEPTGSSRGAGLVVMEEPASRAMELLRPAVLGAAGGAQAEPPERFAAGLRRPDAEPNATPMNERAGSNAAAGAAGDELENPLGPVVSPLAAEPPAGKHSESETPSASTRPVMGWCAWPPARAVPLRLAPWAAMLVLGVLAIVVLSRLAVLGRQLVRLHALRRRCQAPPEGVRARFAALATTLSPHRSAELLVSPASHSPMVTGLFPPAVLVPEALVESGDWGQLDPILRHELAHVQRGDHWVNLAQQAAKALFVFHPAVHWISRMLATEREIACDDFVLHSGHKPRAYALFLAEFASRSQGGDWTAAPAAWSRNSQLTERINMLLKRNRNTSPRLARLRTGLLTTMAAALGTLLMEAAPQVSLAVPPRSNVPSDAPTPAPDQIAAVASGGAAVAGVAPLAVVPAVSASVNALPTTPLVVAASAGTSQSRVPDSGPRPKGAPSAENVAEELAPPPAPPDPFAVAAPPTPPAPPNAPELLGDGPRHAGRHPDSVEQRLDRLERMVKELLARDSKPRLAGPKALVIAPKAGVSTDCTDGDINVKVLVHPDVKAQQEVVAKQLADIQHEGQMQVEINKQVSKEMARAQAEMDRARQEIDRARGKGPSSAFAYNFNQNTAPLEAHRHALEAQRQTLSKQLDAIERQIERLDEAKEKLDEAHERLQEKLQEQAERDQERDSEAQPKPDKK